MKKIFLLFTFLYCILSNHSNLHFKNERNFTIQAKSRQRLSLLFIPLERWRKRITENLLYLCDCNGIYVHLPRLITHRISVVVSVSIASVFRFSRRVKYVFVLFIFLFRHFSSRKN